MQYITKFNFFTLIKPHLDLIPSQSFLNTWFYPNWFSTPRAKSLFSWHFILDEDITEEARKYKRMMDSIEVGPYKKVKG
jgi:hypothetical protein